MAELLQVLVLMAAPATVLATMGYFNRRADRRSAELDCQFFGSSRRRRTCDRRSGQRLRRV